MLVRNPYEIKFTEADLEKVTLEIYIYTGTKDTDKGDIVYTIEGLAFQDDSANPEVIFDLAPFVRDYFRKNIAFNNDYQTFTYWISYVSTRLVDGVAQTPDTIQHLNASFGYHLNNEGANFVGEADGFAFDRFDRDVIVKPKNESLTIPINYDIDEINFIKDNVILYTYTPSGLSGNESEDIIQYINDSNIGNEAFRNEVLRDGGVFLGEECLDYKQNLLRCIYAPIYEYDKVILSRYNTTITGVGNLASKKTIRVESVRTDYDNYKLTFINRKGAFEDLYFYGNSKEKLEVDREEVKRNVRASGTYNTTKHHYRNLGVNGRRSLTLNSGFVPESLNSAFEELLLSEFVWLNKDGKTEPINIKTKNIGFKKQRTEDLIDYSIEVQFSYDVLNNFS